MPSLNRYTLAALAVILPLVAAQASPADNDGGQPRNGPVMLPPGDPDSSSPLKGDDYATWYSNDYDCVINCMQVYNGVKTRERNSTLDQSWISCVTESCDKKYAPQNLYQGMYIQEMFYRTGYIYECGGEFCQPATDASGSNIGTPAAAADETGVSTESAGANHTASSAVSVSGVKTTDSTTTGGTGTAAAPAATATGTGNGAGKVDWSMGMGVAAALAWGAVAIL